MTGRAQRPRGVRTLVRLSASVGLVVIVLFALETSCQIYFRVTDGHWPLAGNEPSAHNTLFEDQPFLVGAPRPGARWSENGVGISISADGLRTTGATAGDSKTTIACLGGSTTFGTRVSDEESWPYRLQSELGDDYRVLNYGVPGYSTVENLIQLALTVPEQRPDIVILFAGWNDIRNYHDPAFTPDYASHGRVQRETFQLHRQTRSALLRAAWQLGSRFRARPVLVGTSGADARVDAIYERNLETVAALAERFDARLILVPQVLNDAFHDSPKPRAWTPRIPDRELPDLLRRFNTAMDRVCAKWGCRVAREVPEAGWGPDDFVDNGHFSAAGGAKFAAILEALVRELEDG